MCQNALQRCNISKNNKGTILTDCAFFFIYSRNAKKLFFPKTEQKKIPLKQ